VSWRTKPSDRFVLRWIKLHLSAPLSFALVQAFPEIRPIVVTVAAVLLGTAGGIAFGLGFGWLGGVLAGAAQVLDGVDGQVARLTGRASPKGAFLDSVLDRYVDFSLLFGILAYGLRFSSGIEVGGFTLTPGWIIVVAALAAAGSSQVSYATARAAALGLDYHRPEHAGKGTRSAVVIVSGVLSPLWVHFPTLALLYLAIHPNAGVLYSLLRVK
jgi:phosphatidylglycerophosphate synthase